MASKSKVSNRKRAASSRKIFLGLTFIPAITFLIKIIVIANIRGSHGEIIGGWFGADGENYMSGLEGLISQGYFSNKGILSYWPAGYPILIWILSQISLIHIILIIALTQTLFYALASYYFVRQLFDTQLRPYLIPISVALAFNPTLSLSSISVGYESPIASCMLMIVAIILKSKVSITQNGFFPQVLSVGVFSAVASFMQPRWMLTSVVIAIFWATMYTNLKVQAIILIGITGIMLIAPAVMIHRNSQAIHEFVISKNLGVTMRIGAGESTSGGYIHTGPEVSCEPNLPSKNVSDSDVVRCVLNWYLAHPVKAASLFMNKAWYFWTPWFGPLVNGTMDRNPWLKIHPGVFLSKGSQFGTEIVFKQFGVCISFLWVVGCISLLFLGFFWLRSMNGIYRDLAYVSLLPIAISWLISIGTIGDSRFRIPTMPLSIFLQVIGFFAIRQKLRTGSFLYSPKN